MQNNYSGSVNIPIKGIVKDLNSSLLKNDVVTHARNATYSSQSEGAPFRKTEQSNTLFKNVPGDIIGDTKLPDGTICLFLTDDVNSQIGIFDPLLNTYTTKINQPWLDFNRKNLITATSKQNSDGSFTIYWSDGRRNPDRILNLSNTSVATFDSIRLSKLITPPKISLQKFSSGVLPDGRYQAAILYSINRVEFDRVYSVTTPISIYNSGSNTGALEVTIDSLDNDFIEFKLIIIQHTKEVTTAKVVGTFSNKTSRVYVSNFNDTEYTPFLLERLVINNPVWVSSDQLDANNEYLFRLGPETVADPNYQLSCFDIKSNYVVKQVPENYYEYGNDDGHYRDEVYSYSIQLLHKLGFYSSKFTIPNREAKGSELEIASGDDVFETSISQCTTPRLVRNFEVINSASDMILTNLPFVDTCEGRIYARGDMAYYESTELYPSNIFQFGDNANKPRRLHKFPSEEQVPRYSKINGKTYINILGIEFKNIPLPKKEDGSVDTDWIGYRIIREELRGNRSIISAGILTNQRIVNDNYNGDAVKVLYSNFYNDLRPDQLISEKQTFRKNNREQDFIPAKEYSNTKFNYYSPHSMIDRRSLGDEMQIVTQETGNVTGSFQKVYKHPKNKLLGLYSYWIASLLGSLEGFLTLSGKTKFTASSNTVSTPPAAVGKEFKMDSEFKVESVEDLISFDIVGAITAAALATDPVKVRTIVKLTLTSLAALGAKVLLFNLYAINKANEIIQIVNDFIDYADYVYQYNSKASYSEYKLSSNGYKRRFVKEFKYLEQGLYDIGNKEYINNFNKEKSIYVELNKPLENITTTDNSKKTMAEFGVNPGDTTNSISTVYYVRNKRRVINQYGRVEAEINPVLIHDHYFNIGEDTTPIFRGGCFINKVSILKEHNFFTQDLSNANFPDGTGYDYRLYRNIGYPRFWANFFKFDFSSYQRISLANLTFGPFSRNAMCMYNLDKAPNSAIGKFRVDDAYMYTSYNGVMEFFCESDYNLDFREVEGIKAYSKDNTNLSDIFRSDKKEKREEFKISRDFSKQGIEIYAEQQPTDYDPVIYNGVKKYDRNRIIYSLPQNREQQFDNWQYFLGNNTYLFPLSEFGNLISLHRVIGDRLLFLFDRSSPYVTIGRDTITLDNTGRKITIGDGGLFAQTIKEVLYTDTAYGNSQSRFGSVNTPYGTYYISERQGRIFRYTDNIKEVCKENVGNWNKQYLPIKLISKFPNYKHSDNTVIGVGYRMGYDSKYEILYLSKKDYYPLSEDIVYNDTLDRFEINGVSIELTDSNYFEDLSLTISLLASAEGIVSYHDWKPDYMLKSENSFFTFKNNSIWKHNSNCQSFCNFYGVQYPYEISIVVPSQFKVKVLSNVEYILEGNRFNPDCINIGNVLNVNFDKVLVYNNEQISGYLNIVDSPSNPIEKSKYPKITQTGTNVLSEKSENKYRINQLRDIVKNRKDDKHLLYWNKNGYTFQVNTEAIDLNKPSHERKMFRHYDTHIWFCKMNPNDVELTFKHLVTKQINSPR